MTRLLTLAVLFASTLALAQGKMAGQARLESQRLCLWRSYLREEKRTFESPVLHLSLTIQFVNQGSTTVTLQYAPVITEWGVADSMSVARRWRKQDFIYVDRIPDNVDWWPIPNVMELAPGMTTAPRSEWHGIGLGVQSNGQRVGPGAHYFTFRFNSGVSGRRNVIGISEPLEFNLPSDMDSKFVEIRNEMVANPSETWKSFGIDTACMDEGSHYIYRPD